MNKILLLVGGVFNLVFGLFHLALGKALNWAETLSCLTLDNRATVYTLNIQLAFICLVFAYLSLFRRKDLLTTGIGRIVMAAMGLYYVLRAINQLVYNGLADPTTSFWLILCGIVSLLYLIPSLMKRPAALAPVVP